MADLSLTVGLKGLDKLSQPLDRAATAARGLGGRLRGAGDGLDRAAQSADRMGRGAKAMTGPMAAAAARVRDLEEKARDIDEFRRLKTAAKANADALAEAQAKTQALGRALGTGADKTKKTAAAFKKARDNLAALKKKTEESTRAVQAQRAKLQQARVATRDLATAQRDLQRDLAQAREAAEDQARALTRAADRARRLARVSDRLHKLAGGLGRAAGAARALAGRLSGTLALVGAIGGAASLAGIGRLVTGFAAANDEISKFARQTGFTAEGIQELQYAANRQGVSQDVFNASIAEFSKRLGELRAGKGTLADFLKDTDPALAATLATARSAEEALGSILTVLEKIDDPQRRAVLADVSFGGEGVRMTRLAEAGAAGLAALRQDARALGMVVDNKTAAAAEGFMDTLTRLQTAFAGLGNTIASQLMPVLEPMIAALTRWIVANRALIADGVERVVTAIGDAIAAIDFPAVVERIKSLWESIAPLADAGVSIGDVVATITTVVDAVGGWEVALVGLDVVLNGNLIESVVTFGNGLRRLATSGLPLVLTGIQAITAVIMANPIGAAIAAIAAAAALIYSNWEPISAWFGELWANIKTVFELAWMGFKIAFGWSPLGKITEYWQPVSAWFSDLWEKIKVVFAAAWEGIKILFGWTPLGMIIKNWEPIVEWFNSLWPKITEPFETMIAFIKENLAFVSSAVDGVSGFFGSVFGDDDDETDAASPATAAKSDGGFFGSVFGSDDTAAASFAARPGLTMPAPVMPAPAAAVAAPAGGAPRTGSAIHNQTINLTVTPPPGVNPQEVARLVMEALDGAQRQPADSDRGRLHDGEE